MSLIRVLKNGLEIRIPSIFLRKRCYYGNYYGSHESIILKFIGNMIHVKKFARELRFDSRGKLAKITCCYPGIKLPALTEDEGKLSAAFEKSGITFFQAQPEMADHILGYYNWFFENPIQSNEYKRLGAQKIDERILSYMVDS